jgi:hypothetical protein
MVIGTAGSYVQMRAYLTPGLEGGWCDFCSRSVAGEFEHHSKEGIMETYQGTQTPSKTEDEFTKSVEHYTAAIPSSAYLGVAIGAMALSLAFQAAGQGKWGNFIAQWVPTWLIIGVYNKLVKLEGHDQTDRGSGYAR